MATVEADDGGIRIADSGGWCVGRLPGPAEFGVALFSGKGDFVGTVGAEAASVRLMCSDGAVLQCDLRAIPGTSAKSFQAVIAPPASPATMVALGADGGEIFRKAYPIIGAPRG